MLQRAGVKFFVGIVVFVVLALPGNSPSTQAWAAAGQPNIVLITIDSMRADRMGFLGSRGGLTPHLDGLAQRSLVFEHAYAQAPETVASTATILTGSYPQIHRASSFGALLAPTVPFLPELLHKSGYRTAAFVGSILLDPANGPFQGYDRGFDEYDAAFHLPQRGASRYQSVARHGSEVVTRATAWLKANKHRPFFLWVNLHDIEGSTGPSYDRTLAGADAAAGKLIEFLRSESLYEDAVIVMASDHGESLGAHGEETHGIFLYDETIHVPLMLMLPGGQMAGKQVTPRVRLLDLAPTVLEAAGVPVSSQMQGQSLIRIAQAATSAGADQPSYARSELPQYGFGCSMLESWRVGKYLYIRAPEPELYDLSADPLASHNLAQSSKATLDTVASQLQALDSRLGNDSGKGVTSALTSSEIQKLASLGYVGLQKTGDGVNSAAAGTDPRQVIALINKTIEALADLDDGSPDKVERILRPVLASKPNLYLAQFGMGVALAQRQRNAESIENLHKAIELRPDSAWAHLAMGLSLMQTGDFKTAAVHLEIASEHLPASSMLHSKLAEVYDRLGRKDDAARERTRAAQKGA